MKHLLVTTLAAGIISVSCSTQRGGAGTETATTSSPGDDASTPTNKGSAAHGNHSTEGAAHDEHAGDEHHHHHHGSSERLDPQSEEILSDFTVAGEALEGDPSAPQAIEPERSRRGNPDHFAVLGVGRTDNPMLNPECRREAIRAAVEQLGDHGQHLKEHSEDDVSRPVSLSEYMSEIAECKEFCGPVMASIIKCHVAAVARWGPNLVLFDYDSPAIRDDQASTVERIAESARYGKRVLLIGRASLPADPSRMHEPNIWSRNETLARDRALAVKDMLVQLGIPEDRILSRWWGFQPPQIQDWIAREYKMESLYESVGKAGMNQSVEAVVYSPSGGSASN